MKKMAMVVIVGMIIFTLSSCGQTKNLEDNQANIKSSMTEIGDAEGKVQKTQNDDSASSADTDLADKANNDGQIKKDDELEKLIGEYDYLSDYGIGKLIIEKTDYGYDISDYESESSYRFLADSSNIETIENNRIYIKYPEQVFSDDTVIFSYYILEYSTDEINVYYRKSTQEESQFLYHATKKNAEDTEKIVDCKALGIKEYEYPAEFSMGENLKTAITQLALCYDSFDKDSVYSAEWKETFIDRFIQNSRVSFDYLDMVSDNNNGEIGIDELNYMQYSLTGIELDFTSCVNGTVNRYDDSSTLNYGWISDWDYEYTDDGVTVTVNFEVGTDGTDVTQERELTVNLVKNPYSCFDGYSVAAITLLDYNAAYSNYIDLLSTEEVIGVDDDR